MPVAGLGAEPIPEDGTLRLQVAARQLPQRRLRRLWFRRLMGGPAWDCLREVRATLWRNKLRSFLSLFGIAWGVGSLILVTALTEGFRQGQRKNMAQLGDRIVFVFPGRTEQQAGGARAGRRIRLHWDDVEAVRANCPAVEVVAPEVKTVDVPVRSTYNAGRFLTLGVTAEYLQIRNLPIGEGRHISADDVREARRVTVLGASVREQLFPQSQPVLGQAVYIAGLPYSVVGVMAKKNQNSSYDGWDNDKVVIPATALLRDIPPSRQAYAEKQVNLIVYRARNPRQWAEAQRQVRAVLARRYQFLPTDEGALHFWDTVEDSERLDQVFDSMEIFLGAVGLITLSLGGIGVMNTMRISVVERTQEIGLRMALGATRRRVLVEFFLEGLMLALLGGLGGLAIVLLLVFGLNSLPMPAMFAGLVVRWAALLAVTATLGTVATLAALVPAWQAAKMTPVEALRSEV